MSDISNGRVVKAHLSFYPPELAEGENVDELRLYDGAGNPITVPGQAAAQADTVAADLAALKVDFNLLLTNLRASGTVAIA